jgi:hypothetical protein
MTTIVATSRGRILVQTSGVKGYESDLRGLAVPQGNIDHRGSDNQMDQGDSGVEWKRLMD